MARAVRNSKTDSRSARTKLAEKREPYWSVISQGCAVGYRKGAKGGTWIARFRDEDGRQLYEALGAADDARDADGVSVFSFVQAQEKARAWFAQKARERAGDFVASEGPYTVSDALRDYLSAYGAGHTKGGGKSLDRTKAVAEALILPDLGNVPLVKLSKRRLTEWRDKVAATPARLRSKPGEAQKFREADASPEGVRRRRSSTNRVLTVLKAALNHAHQEGRVASDDAWRLVKPFREADAARLRYLSDDEARRLVNACPVDFRKLVVAALMTGCRCGELAALRVADFHRDAGTIHVRSSKSGKPRHIALTDEGRQFFETVTAGRGSAECLLVRTDGSPWGRSHQVRPIADACAAANISPACSFHELRHSYASRLAMKGVPLMVIAQQLGHTDTRMVEKHYGHLSPNYVAETVRAAFGTLGVVETTNVVPLRKAD